MEENRDKAITFWLLSVSALIVLLIVYGGWVRLTRSGLSIVEWNVVTGVIPPVGEPAWYQAFESYKRTPEYEKINVGMTLEQFKAIYFREYNHRILGRIAGLVYVIPLFGFLLRGAIRRERIPAFLGIGLLFALQGLLGWFMVQSGLVDQPQVSHYRLTIHLLAALALLAACLWLALDYLHHNRPAAAASTLLRRLGAGLFALVTLQIAAGALVAGSKAGHISDTFPKMFGQWVPGGLLSSVPTLLNFFENPITLHFQHRWFGFAVAGMAGILFWRCQAEGTAGELRRAAVAILHLVVVQIVLGVVVVLWHITPWLASLHQFMAVCIFIASLYAWHRAQRASPLPLGKK